jgi:phenylalanyl-tRNA synthetase beta chain
MKVSLSWLRTLAAAPLSNDQLASRLTMAGLEVEEQQTAAPPFTSVVVGLIKAAAKHPDADKLQVCTVDVGDGTDRQIVCGAPNARAGILVPCALVGAQLPGGMAIKLAKMRGVESQGMLCSARELGLSEDAAGLLELPSDSKPGANLRELLDLDDCLLTLKVTPNRADCLSMIGVAREVAGLAGVPLNAPAMLKPTVTLSDRLPVAIQAPDLCGRFSGRVIRAVNAQAPTPTWMRQRLERSGQRSISALVDISNYVMLELGRPTHVFDLEKIHGGLTVRWAKEGESLKLLNGQTVQLTADVGVIADDKQVESLAGIMGGDSTAVSLYTTAVYVEAAFWWPAAVAGRSRRYNFATDAGYRFERGVDFATTVDHVDYISALIQSICGGNCGPVDDQVLNLPKRDPVKMRLARAEKIIGLQVQNPLEKLRSLGLKAEQEGDSLVVTPPSYRFDLSIEEDIIEELARLHGLENLPLSAPIVSASISARPVGALTQSALRRRIAARDYMEVINFSFVNSQMLAHFSPTDVPIKVLNPIADTLDVMRTSLWAGMLENLKHNLNRKAARVRLFEIGRTFHRSPDAKAGPLDVAQVYQPWRAAMLSYGDAMVEQWGSAARAGDFFDLKADLQAIVSHASVTTERAEHPALHPGQSARVLINGKACGWLGALHPALVQTLGLITAPILLEVELAPLIARELTHFEEVSKFPLVQRDIAIVVSETLPAQTVLDCIWRSCRENPTMAYVRNVMLFDEYRGKGLENKEKSLAFRFTMQDTQKTLSDQESDNVIAEVVARLAQDFGARLRS